MKDIQSDSMSDYGRPQVFVSGTWRPDKAKPYRDPAGQLGRSLAARGFDLACGPGTGIARHVIDGFRSVADRIGIVRFYLPEMSHMNLVGEEIAPGSDEIVETEYDYPMRNTFQISRCHGLFVITGGDGTLEEILPAVIDYNLPVAAIRSSGSAALAVEALLPLYPDWRQLITLGDDVSDLVPDFAAKVWERFKT